MAECIELNKIAIRNVACHHNTDIDFNDHSGLVIVTGHNQDSLKSTGQSNGAGKTVPFSLIPNVRFESTPLAQKRGSKKAVLSKKNSSITLDFRSPYGKEISVCQKGANYIYSEDGEDQKKQKQTYVKEALEKHFPITSSEFYSYTYLMFQRNMEFQHSTPANRLEYITKMFRLDIFDKLRFHFNQERGKVKDFERDFQSAVQRLETLDIKITDLAHPENADELMEEAEKRLKKFRRKYDGIIADKSILDASLDEIDEAKKAFAKVAKYKKRLGKFDDTMVALLRKQLKVADAWASYTKVTEPLKQKKLELEEKLAGIPDKIKDLKTTNLVKRENDLEELVEQYSSDIRKAEKHNEKVDDLTDELKALVKKLKKLGFKESDVPKGSVSDQLSIYKSVVETYEELVDHDEGHDDSCPLCKQDLDMDKLKKNAKKAKAQIKKLQSIAKAQDIILSLRGLEDQLNSLGSTISTGIFKRKRKETKAKLDKLEAKLDLYEEYKKLDNRHKDIVDSMPDKPKSKKPKKRSGEIETLLEQWEWYDIAVSDASSVKRKFKDLDLSKDAVKEVNLKSIALQSELNLLGKKQVKANNTFLRLQSSATKLKIYKADRKEIKKELKRLKPHVSKRKVVDGLHKFYGASNAKLTHAMGILKQLEDSLNMYQSLVFCEPMHFEFQQTAQGISAMVTRSNGDTSDINQLSGGESSCFRLLWAFALLPLIPPHRRTNCIILDEPDTACDDTVRELLVNDFLPKLRSIVPNVFWITPLNTDIFHENCDKWKVIKKNGVSTLHKE